MIPAASVGSFRRTLDAVNALVRTCVDCDRYPGVETGAGDVIADCSKTYVSILGVRATGDFCACRVYSVEIQVALVYVCADLTAGLCLVDDMEAIVCCLEAACDIFPDQVVPGRGLVSVVRYDRPRGGAHVARVTLTVPAVVCCGDL